MNQLKEGFQKDPVCEMIVPEQKHAIVFLQMHFAFCSQQCKQRFQQSPYLYIAKNGQKSVKQEGLQVIKDRRIKLDKPMTDQETKRVVEALGAMMGILEVDIKGNVILLRYDLLQATQEQIEIELTTLGLKLGSNWQERVRRGLVQFFEDNECSTLSINPRKGCH